MEAPFNIQNHRREQCERCKTPCKYQNDIEYRKEGDNVCPIGKWMAFKTYTKQKWSGLGDAVASVAEPISAAMDKVLKTRTKGCGGCAKRREMLNHLLPFGQKQ